MRFRAWIVIACAGVMLGGCSSADVSSFRVMKDAEALQSLAAEGALLVGATAAGESTKAFTSVHAGELAAEARGLAEVLRLADPPAELAAATARIVHLASLAGSSLAALPDALSSGLASRIQRRLARIAGEAGRLAESQ